MRILAVSPHPDDELIGAPATLMALRDAGWGVSNYAVSLGRPDDQTRRRAELEEACRRARFDLILPEESLPISSDDDLRLAEEDLVERLGHYVNSCDIILSPSPHDRHHGHEVVARAVRRAIEEADNAPRWWMWGLWGDLPLPNIICNFSQERLEEINHALAAHQGEVQRNDYRHLVEGRARANAVLGQERVFGFGTKQLRTYEYAEVVCEAVRRNGLWLLGASRGLDIAEPIAAQPTEINMNFWLNSLSLTTQLQLLTKDLLEDLFARDPSLEDS